MLVIIIVVLLYTIEYMTLSRPISPATCLTMPLRCAYVFITLLAVIVPLRHRFPYGLFVHTMYEYKYMLSLSDKAQGPKSGTPCCGIRTMPILLYYIMLFLKYFQMEYLLRICVRWMEMVITNPFCVHKACSRSAMHFVYTLSTCSFHNPIDPIVQCTDGFSEAVVNLLPSCRLENSTTAAGTDTKYRCCVICMHFANNKQKLSFISLKTIVTSARYMYVIIYLRFCQ